MKLIENASAPAAQAIVGVDVGKEELHLYTEIGGRIVRRSFANRTRSIERNLERLLSEDEINTRRRLLAVEPTGSYHESLLRTARKMGFETAWVDGERVASMRLVEFGDRGKTDKRDPQAIFRLADLGYLVKRREFDERYQLLREWHHVYSAAEDDQKSAKGSLHHELQKLFPDFDFKPEFFYSDSGRALVHLYGANPHRIGKAGPKRFRSRMKKRAPRMHSRSLERLLETAQASRRSGPSEAHAGVIEVRLRQLYDDFLEAERRKAKAAKEMERLYSEIRANDDSALPQAVPGVITHFHLARLVAEIGPLSDFKSWRQLCRYAGLNLREKQSGSFRGRTRITKRGRVLLRKALTHVALPLVKRTRLFGPYYHHKREVEKMQGAKAMASVSRKLLKMIFGWYQSGSAFAEDRVFTCESQYQAAA